MNEDEQDPVLNEEENQGPECSEAGAAEESNPGESKYSEASEKETAEELTPEKEILKWKDAALRSAAELENYRKRMVREKADAIRFANQRLLSELLPVLDNFEMGMMAAEKDKESMIYMGMAMVQKQLGDFLDNLGVTPVKAEGEFDHSLHDAVSEEESEDVPEGHIVRVARRGFKLNDRLLRPASVVVAKKTSEGEASATDSSEEQTPFAEA